MAEEGEEDFAKLKLGEIFEAADSYSVLNAEVALILENKLANTPEDADSTATEMLHKFKAYVDRFNMYSGQENVKKVRELLERRGLHDFEVSAVANLHPGQADEAFSLVKSLRDQIHTDLTEESANEMLEELATYR